MQIVKHELNRDSTYDFEVTGCKGADALVFLDWIKENKEGECNQGELSIHTIIDGFEVAYLRATYSEGSFDSGTLSCLQGMVVVKATGHCGYGRADFDLYVCTATQYVLWHEMPPTYSKL